MILLMVFTANIFCFLMTAILWNFARKTEQKKISHLDLSFISFISALILTTASVVDEMVSLHWYMYGVSNVLFSVCMGISGFFFSQSVFDVSKNAGSLKRNVVSSSVMLIFGLISVWFVKYRIRITLYIWILAMSYFVLKTMYAKISVDNLTRLHNRYGMDEKIREQLQQYAKDKNDSFYLIVCDLDNFKHINDTWGHLEGDRALILISSALLEVSKEFNSKVFRIGGDEFVIITDKSDEGLAYRITERIKEQLDKIDFRDDFRIKISMGVSLYDGKTRIKDLLENADKKMYEAKILAKDL